MNKCFICDKNAIFKIKGEEIYYCKEHAEEFFTKDALLGVDLIEKEAIKAQKLKHLIENKIK